MNHYRPHLKDDGRLYFQFVCPFTPGGGTPSSCWGVPSSPGPGGGYPIHLMGGGGTSSQIQAWGTNPADGGYPIQLMGVRQQGVPPSREYPPAGGIPSGRGYPQQGYPSPGRGYPPPQQGVPPTRAAWRVLATRRAVCLLRSRRRTFLFFLYFWTFKKC